MIQIRQVEAFRAVMLTGSMTAGANMIGITQPAVSRLIRDLEAELGVSLFDRRGNLLTPTTQAASFFEEVDRSYAGLERLRTYAADLRAGRGGSIRVAALPAMTTFLARFAARFARNRAGLDILIDSLPSATIRDEVIKAQLDLGLTASPFPAAPLTVIPISDHAVIVLPVGHDLARRTVIRAEDLQGTDLVLLSKFWNGTRHPVELALQNVDRGRVWVTPISTVACALVAEGAGVAIVDPFSASDFAGRGLVLRPFDPPTLIGTAIVHSSERPLSKLAAEFLAAFNRHTTDFLRDADYLRTGL